MSNGQAIDFTIKGAHMHLYKRREKRFITIDD